MTDNYALALYTAFYCEECDIYYTVHTWKDILATDGRIRCWNHEEGE